MRIINDKIAENLLSLCEKAGMEIEQIDEAKPIRLFELTNFNWDQLKYYPNGSADRIKDSLDLNKGSIYNILVEENDDIFFFKGGMFQDFTSYNYFKIPVSFLFCEENFDSEIININDRLIVVKSKFPSSSENRFYIMKLKCFLKNKEYWNNYFRSLS